MKFEDLTLRPTSGTVDVTAVTAWLSARPYAFFDPVVGDGWHLSATPALMALSRQERIDHPREFPVGVRVTVSPDHVWLSGRADRDNLARALEFVQWLVREGEWMAKRDSSASEPLGDPRRLFPEGLVDPALLDDDRTLTPVTQGTLVTWSPASDDGSSLAVHSSGQWRYAGHGRALRGRLSDDARAAWNAAVAAAESADATLRAEPDPSSAVAVEFETPEALTTLELDPDDPPAAYRPLAALASEWIASFASWTPQARLRGVQDCFLS
jgi:hypothetical protein